MLFFQDEEDLVVEFIGPCLTSIYQPPGITVSGALKKTFREEYHNHVAKLFSISKQPASIKVRDKILISGEEFIRFIKTVHKKSTLQIE